MTPTTMHLHRPVLTALIWASVVSASSAQTPITPDKNKYTPAQDVQIGREATTEVRRELPMLNDARVDSYVERVGRDLVRGIPQQFQHDEFRYTFDVVNQKEINAFALPGGPMFLNRGMIEAAKSEGEVAGVMAHEIAHVALRHGTAQATKGQKFQIGAIAGQILGAIVGGAAGSVIAQGSQFGLGAYFLNYGRDTNGRRIFSARRSWRVPVRPSPHGRHVSNDREAGRRARRPGVAEQPPESRESLRSDCERAETLRIQGSAPSEAEFQSAQSRLRGMKPAYTAEQIARAKQNGGRLPSSGGGNPSDVPVRAGNGQVEPPSGQFQPVTLGNFLRASVPSNWRQRSSNEDSVTFAPEAAITEARTARRVLRTVCRWASSRPSRPICRTPQRH